MALVTAAAEPGRLFANITPNWFAAVMGTGIVATAAAGLPEQFLGLRAAAVVFWAGAAALLVVLVVATALHWIHFPSTARRYLRDPVMAHFYGAPPMALLTVGAATLLIGRDVIGLRAAVDIDWGLWFAGTVAGLCTAAVVPYLAFTGRRHWSALGRRAAGPLGPPPRQSAPPPGTDSAFGGWLMPIVPPMVSASTGALLVAHAPAGPGRLSLLLCCYAMFGLALIGSTVVITLIWRRLARHDIGEPRLVPTLWIVLGPLGQSITAANLLGGAAHLALPAPYARALVIFGVVFGLPVLGFALMWAAMAAAITRRATRDHLPFSLTWWSFTFPVGTVVTGTSSLALHTGSVALRVAAAIFYAVLVGAWLMVATRTAEASIRGDLLRPPAAHHPVSWPTTDSAEDPYSVAGADVPVPVEGLAQRLLAHPA